MGPGKGTGKGQKPSGDSLTTRDQSPIEKKIHEQGLYVPDCPTVPKWTQTEQNTHQGKVPQGVWEPGPSPQKHFTIREQSFYADGARSTRVHSRNAVTALHAVGASALQERPPGAPSGFRLLAFGHSSLRLHGSQNSQLTHPPHSPPLPTNRLFPEMNEFHPPWVSFFCLFFFLHFFNSFLLLVSFL